MSKNEQSERVLRNLGGHVESLNNIFGRLLHTMDGQIEAIVSSNPKAIERLTEEHTMLSTDYKIAEKSFISELKKQFKRKGDQTPRLSDLKEIYPEATDLIESWREVLTENTKRIQQKHEHVVRLLEFALLRNSSMMRSIYTIQNNKTAHYTLEGNKKNKMSGLAVNQKI